MICASAACSQCAPGSHTHKHIALTVWVLPLPPQFPHNDGVGGANDKLNYGAIMCERVFAVRVWRTFGLGWSRSTLWVWACLCVHTASAEHVFCTSCAESYSTILDGSRDMVQGQQHHHDGNTHIGTLCLSQRPRALERSPFQTYHVLISNAKPAQFRRQHNCCSCCCSCCVLLVT